MAKTKQSVLFWIVGVVDVELGVDRRLPSREGRKDSQSNKGIVRPRSFTEIQVSRRIEGGKRLYFIVGTWQQSKGAMMEHNSSNVRGKVTMIEDKA